MKFSVLQLKKSNDGNCVEIDIPTASLIAELEARRPCKECNTQSDMRCVSCLWSAVWSMNKKDNFTPTAKKERE